MLHMASSGVLGAIKRKLGNGFHSPDALLGSLEGYPTPSPCVVESFPSDTSSRAVRLPRGGVCSPWEWRFQKIKIKTASLFLIWLCKSHSITSEALDWWPVSLGAHPPTYKRGDYTKTWIPGGSLGSVVVDWIVFSKKRYVQVLALSLCE